MDSKRICCEKNKWILQNLKGLKLSDIIIIAGLALIGSEGNIDIKHAIHVKPCDTDANLSQPLNDSC